MHHPVIQEEVGKLLAKGATELSTGVGFYPNVSLIASHMGGFSPIPNLI